MNSGVIRDPNSLRLFWGQVISQICDKMMTVGLIWVIVGTHSMRAVPVFLAVSALPHLLLSLCSAQMIARLGALRAVIATDLIRAALFLGLASLWSYVPTRTVFIALLTASFLSNVAGAIFNPAILSLPTLVAKEDQLQKLTALIDTCFSVGTIVGPILSAVLFPSLGLRGLFLLNGLSYLFAAGLESRVVVHATPAPGVSGHSESAFGFQNIRQVLKSDALVAFMLGTFLAINLFLGPVMVFLPLLAKTVFSGTIGSLAELETSVGLGTVLGGVYLTLKGSQEKVGVKILTCMGMMAASYFAFSLSKNIWVASFFLIALGFSLALANVMIMSLFQVRSLPENVPAIMSIVNLISVASLPISMLGVGFALNFVKVSSLALLFSVIVMIITFIAALNVELRCQTSQSNPK